MWRVLCCQAIDELLSYDADPCLPLTHGVGNVLCIASSTEYEHRRTPLNRLKLVSAPARLAVSQARVAVAGLSTVDATSHVL